MILAKLIATLLIRRIPAAARVNASSHRTPLTIPSITVRSPDPLRLRSLAWSLPQPSRGVRHDHISVVKPRLRLRHFVGHRGNGLNHLRLLFARQAIELTSTGDPGLARFIEQILCYRIYR